MLLRVSLVGDAAGVVARVGAGGALRVEGLVGSLRVLDEVGQRRRPWVRDAIFEPARDKRLLVKNAGRILAQEPTLCMKFR